MKKYTVLESEMVSGIRYLKRDLAKMIRETDRDREEGGDPGYEPIVAETMERLDLLLAIAKKHSGKRTKT